MDSNHCFGYEQAIDVCCGSGQSTMLLSPLFKNVCGYDNSPAQISQAKSKHETAEGNVLFEIGDAHSLPVESSSVDLLTCAMGWHLLDPDKFYSEAKCVLKPKGCLAVYGYNVKVRDNTLVGSLMEAFLRELIQKECVTEQSFAVLNEYSDVVLPFSKTQRINFHLPQRVSIDQLFGFFESFSCYRTYCKKFPENKFLEILRKEYSGQWSGDNYGAGIHPSWFYDSWSS